MLLLTRLGLLSLQFRSRIAEERRSCNKKGRCNFSLYCLLFQLLVVAVDDDDELAIIIPRVDAHSLHANLEGRKKYLTLQLLSSVTEWMIQRIRPP